MSNEVPEIKKRNSVDSITSCLSLVFLAVSTFLTARCYVRISRLCECCNHYVSCC